MTSTTIFFSVPRNSFRNKFKVDEICANTILRLEGKIEILNIFCSSSLRALCWTSEFQLCRRLLDTRNSRNTLKHTTFYDFPQDKVCSPVRLNLRGLCWELINLCPRLLRDFKLFIVFLASLFQRKSPTFSGKTCTEHENKFKVRKSCFLFKKEVQQNNFN